LLSHAGDEHAVDAGEYQVLGNPLLLRRALDHGVRVIVAHCATIGSNVDLDRGQHGPQTANLTLFSRLMDEPRYVDRLFGDISAITQVNRSQAALEMIYRRDDWHHRLLYGSDYPLPGAMPVFSLDTMVGRSYISTQQATLLSQIRQHNALLFDFLLKRMITVQGKQLDNTVFESGRFF
ncbi:MAG: amidohydrolase, partial [Gammaproteobacteria bacterium]|nr:amidohydrolase [Gammaproteobacteria bacterium]